MLVFYIWKIWRKWISNCKSASKWLCHLVEPFKRYTRFSMFQYNNLSICQSRAFTATLQSQKLLLLGTKLFCKFGGLNLRIISVHMITLIFKSHFSMHEDDRSYFIKSFDSLLRKFRSVNSKISYSHFSSFCTSFHGCELWLESKNAAML